MTYAHPKPGIGSLWRTTTVRLTVLFIAIFVGFAIVLLGYLAFQTSIQIQRQQVTAIEREVAQIELLSRQANIRAVAFAIQRLADRPGPGIYYLGDQAGTMLAGNVSDLPAALLVEPGRYELTYERGLEIYGEPDESLPTSGTAIVDSLTLPNGLQLVVGRDVGERRSFTGIIFTTFLWGAVAIVLLSILAGGITARYVLRRIDAITGTSRKIMSGDLSERIPVTHRNDEFDSMATHLNAMLDRIEQLMTGLKEVTDNVAHDLKTPLTRLRNKAEAALRENADPEAQRLALETTIAESDQLIRTFNALLLIARAEAGTPSGALTETDISAVVADVADLYGPVAEDAGLTLTADIAPGIAMQASRELIGQALVNLVENAIKYGGKDEAGTITLSLRREAQDIVIEIADNGPGILQTDRQRVFERFARLESSRTEPGAGLGLSLVSAVVRLHGGTVHFEDNGPGARAVIRFSGR
ncbi:HAMP domain-containing sensor histidine kinase [Pelagibacterium sediminicola]|uniref:HAMP domain-containing sensor histidine kinase n=1 Tax=Pelagibacterium sediminicola TaxID=2248761 RepID=UPI0018E59869|nr:HAMP domain-containing sensor histidine kinase [Pelagibacterium sediminicola]